MRLAIIAWITVHLLVGCSTKDSGQANVFRMVEQSPPPAPPLQSIERPHDAITIFEALEDARILILADDSTFRDQSKALIERRYKHRPFWDELNVVVSLMNFRQVTGAYGIAIKKDDGWHVLVLKDMPSDKLPKPDKLYFFKDRVGRSEIWYPADNDGRPLR
jgi:hypothetical protein